MDMLCMSKHRKSLENFVIKDETYPFILHQAVADSLAKYYAKSGSEPTEESRLVLAKLTTFMQARKIEMDSFKSHMLSNCPADKDVCLDMSDGQVFQEERLKVRLYFQTVDPKLYAPEIKYLDREFKLHAQNL